MNKAEQLIACLEGEIAKRDARIVEFEEGAQKWVKKCLAISNENAQLRAELSALKAQEPVAWAATARKKGVTDQRSFWHGEAAADEWISHYIGRGCDVTKTALYAAPVSEAKAQGVVMPERETELFNAAYGAAVESGWESVKCMARQIWDAARLNAAPAAPAADAGLVEALEKYADDENWCYDTCNIGRSVAQAALSANRAKGVA